MGRSATIWVCLLAVALWGATLVGCTDTHSRARAVYVLLDTSGTYAREVDKAVKIVSYLLAISRPGDSLGVARIDSESFSEKDIIASVTFDQRPSVANAEKRSYHELIKGFAATVQGSAYTDISGGLLQAVEYLNETRAGNRYIFLFSDLKEDLMRGHVRDFGYDFSGTQVVALNVTKLKSDSRNPSEYLERLEEWQNYVTSQGGTWRVINDISHLESVFDS
jgi:hypothetical protein